MMSQENILNLLSKMRKPLSRSEIATLLNENANHVSHHLQKLVIHQEIKIIEIDRIQAKAFFKNKAPSRRMRLYYV